MRRHSLLLVGIALCFSLASVAEASLNYSTAGSTVGQNFNTLSQTGTANTWSDNSTITGWYSSRTTYRAGTGSVTNGDLYSFGSASASDRALGSVASGTTGTIAYGVKYINTTGLTLDSITVTYVGEQWRNGGNTTAQSLTFDYQLDGGLFNPVSALDFSSPIATATAGALDGNAAANKVAISSTINNIVWNPGDELFLRWTDINHDGNDHGVAIDDFQFSANYTPDVVPEPTSLLAWGGIGLLSLGLIAWKKKAA